jgi:general secretion pathway protein C
MKKNEERYIRKAFYVGKLALASVLLFGVVRIVITPQRTAEFFAPTSAGGAATVSSIEEKNPLVTSVEDYSEIVEQNIFGLPVSSSATNKSLPAGNNAGLPSAEEELGLELVGTVAGSPEVSRAVIKELETSVLNVYRTGETVAAADIESIEKDSVVLLHQGQRKVLNLSTRASEQQRADNPKKPPKKDTNRRSAPVESQPPDNSHPSGAAKIKHTEIILTEAIIEPYAVDGRVEGLRITGIENMEAARSLGLKNGDIIRAVNGRRLTSRQQAFQVLKKARSKPDISVELMRGDKIGTLSFSLL